MNEKEIKLFDDYAKHYHFKHEQEKQKRDIEYWQKRIEKCETYEQLLSQEMILINIVDWNTFIRLRQFINEKLTNLIKENYIHKDYILKEPLTLTQKIKYLFK